MAKRQPVNPDDVLKLMYPDLQTSDDYEAAQVKAKDDTAGKEKDDKIAQLQAQIDQLRGATVRSGSGRKIELTVPTAPVQPVIDYNAFPDPATDPKGYAAAVSQATKAQIDYEKAAYQWQQQMAQNISARGDELWNTFQNIHPEYAGDPEKIEMIVNQITTKKKAQGVNLDKYMYETTDDFMADVTAAYDKLFGKPKLETDEDEEEDDRSQVMGGGVAGVSGPQEVQQPPQKYGTLGQDVVDWQRKMGFRM